MNAVKLANTNEPPLTAGKKTADGRTPDKYKLSLWFAAPLTPIRTKITARATISFHDFMPSFYSVPCFSLILEINALTNDKTAPAKNETIKNPFNSFLYCEG